MRQQQQQPPSFSAFDIDGIKLFQGHQATPAPIRLCNRSTDVDH
jgi:tRNA U55 pseudouridine synthase TruB